MTMNKDIQEHISNIPVYIELPKPFSHTRRVESF